MAVLNPDLFTTQEMAGDVEIQGDLTMGRHGVRPPSRSPGVTTSRAVVTCRKTR